MNDQQIAVLRRVLWHVDRAEDQQICAQIKSAFWQELGDRRTGEQRREDRRKAIVEKREKEAAK